VEVHSRPGPEDRTTSSPGSPTRVPSRCCDLRPHLIELASLPNVYEDRDSGVFDIAVGRRCFLIVDPEDGILVPPDVLVFRHKDQPPKWINSSWVCP
jgi:hypothetical protein